MIQRKLCCDNLAFIIASSLHWQVERTWTGADSNLKVSLKVVDVNKTNIGHVVLPKHLSTGARDKWKSAYGDHEKLRALIDGAKSELDDAFKRETTITEADDDSIVQR